MSREIPILFSTEMVKAILLGQKTMTRRVIKESFNGCLTNGGPHPCPNDPIVFYPGEKIQNPNYPEELVIHESKTIEAHFWCSTMDKVAKCRFGLPGDRLWVRESFKKWDIGGGAGVNYRADFSEKENDVWKPSIHMKKEYARIWLEVVSIKVEALNAIKPEDAIREGYPFNAPPATDLATYIVWFKSIWEMVNGEGSWAVDPWVWVIEFKVLSTHGRP